MKIEKSILQLVASSLIFGIGTVLVVYIDLSPLMIAFYRLFIGALLFALVLLLRHESFVISRLALGFSLSAGAFLGLDLSLWNSGILSVGPGIATLLNSLQVFFMAGFGLLIFRDRPSIKLLVSLLTTFIGVVLLCRREIAVNDAGRFGIIVSILSALAFALSMLCLREAVKRQTVSLVNTMFYASLGGSLATGLYALFSGTRFYTEDSLSWGLIAIYGLFVHVLAWFLMAKSLPQLSLAIAGLVMCLEPVVAFVLDMSLFDKSVSLWQLFGALLTMFAVYLGSQSAKGDKTA